MDAREKQLWENYSAERTIAHRNALVELHMPYAKMLFARRAANLPGWVDQSGLLSAAYLSLIGAVERFDVARGFQFATFAQRRILGAMDDELREQAPVSRLATDRGKRLDEARQKAAVAGHRVSDYQLAEMLGFDRAQLRMAAVQAPGSLDCRMARGNSDQDSDNPMAVRDAQADPKLRGPLQNALKAEIVERVIAPLSLDEKTVVYLYHIKGRTLKQIGESLNLSESRVSQMHSAIAERLRAILDGDELWKDLRSAS